MKNFTNLICMDANADQASWIANSFPVIKIVLVCLLAVFSIAMIIFILMQKSNTNGISAVTGQSNTFYNRNKGATLQGKVKNLTIICAVCMMVIVIAYLIISQIHTGFIK
jgi:preprotein translocase subunit SecG